MFYLKFIQGEAEKSRTSSVYRRKGKGEGGSACCLQLPEGAELGLPVLGTHCWLGCGPGTGTAPFPEVWGFAEKFNLHLNLNGFPSLPLEVPKLANPGLLPVTACRQPCAPATGGSKNTSCSF